MKNPPPSPFWNIIYMYSMHTFVWKNLLLALKAITC